MTPWKGTANSVAFYVLSTVLYFYVKRYMCDVREIVVMGGQALRKKFFFFSFLFFFWKSS
ncbi:hypothetical protein F4860DRAFT_462499 [Xylaria cubensis]|nr:hypothetical protein F4860DRAFT_462499 [Xylaria cubensis]